MIGLSLFFAAAIVIFAILWLGKSDFFMKGTRLNMVVDNAKGIVPGDEVFFRGLKVGNVIDALIIKNGVLLKLKIEDVEEIPVDSRFEIGDFSLLSGTGVSIIPGISEVCYQSNDTVRGHAAYGLNEAMANLQGIETKLTSVLSNLDEITGGNTRNRIDSVLNNLNVTIAQLNSQVSGNLRRTLSNMNDLASDNRQNISELVRSLSENSKQLSIFLKSSSKSAEHLDSLLTRVNDGKGSLGGLVKSDSLYDSLGRTLASIDSLVKDIKKNPQKYLSVNLF